MATLANVGIAFGDLPALVSTFALTITCIACMYHAVVRSDQVPPLHDLAFVYAALVYYALPALTPIIDSRQQLVGTFALQQALVGSMVAAFHLVRSLGDWGSWRAGMNVHSAEPARTELRSVVLLIAVTAIWLLVLSFFLGDHIRTEYGRREPGQRSPMNIPLLGFDYFGTAVCALVLMFASSKAEARNWRWVVGGVIFFVAFASGSLIVFGARTKIIWCLLLAAVPLLLKFRLTMGRIVLLSTLLVALLPVFDYVPRARASIHTLDSELILGAADATRDRTLGEMFTGSEPVVALPHAETIIKTLGREKVYGEYIAWSFIQSPPSFILRSFGLENTRSLGTRYVVEFFPVDYRLGGGFGLPLAGEAYCNAGELGGVFGGVVLALLMTGFERIAAVARSRSIVLAVHASFIVNTARVNRQGIESLAKPFLIFAIFLVLWRLVLAVTRRLDVAAERKAELS